MNTKLKYYSYKLNISSSHLQMLTKEQWTRTASFRDFLNKYIEYSHNRYNKMMLNYISNAKNEHKEGKKIEREE